MSKISTYKELVVWQKSHDLVKEIVKITLPKTDESRIIRNQLLRAAFSVSANIAEGFGGYKGKSYRHFLIIARRSLTETDYWLLLLNDLTLIPKDSYNDLFGKMNEINAILSTIINKLDTANKAKGGSDKVHV